MRDSRQKITLVLSRTAFRYNEHDRIVPVDCSNEVDELRVGEKFAVEAGAPGCGRIVYRIVRVDRDGAWGFVLSNTMRELTLADVI